MPLPTTVGRKTRSRSTRTSIECGPTRCSRVWVGTPRHASTLRYVDGLPVPQVAELLGRTVHATEALLVRGRAAFRKIYASGERDG